MTMSQYGLWNDLQKQMKSEKNGLSRRLQQADELNAELQAEIERLKKKISRHESTITSQNNRIEKLSKRVLAMENNEKVLKKFLKGRTYAETQFGIMLIKFRTLLKRMQRIQDKYEKGTNEYLISRTIIVIIKRVLGLYAREVKIKVKSRGKEKRI